MQQFTSDEPGSVPSQVDSDGREDEDGLVYVADAVQDAPTPMSPAPVQDAGERYTVPEAGTVVDDRLFDVAESPVPLRTLPEPLITEMRRQAELNGEPLRTVLVRWLMIAHDARPDLQPVELPRSQLVDLRARERKIRAYALDMLRSQPKRR